MMPDLRHSVEKETIRIGTLVNCNAPNPVKYIQQILPHGFESFSLTFWETLGETNISRLAENIQRVLEGTGVVISSLSVYGNPLESKEVNVETLKSWNTLIANAHLFDTDLVTGFTGRLRGKLLHESIPRFAEIFGPLAEKARGKGVRLAFENCSMDGTWYQGDWNIAHNPVAWDLMFEALPYENLGLEWEPCHQLVALIDPMPQLREWVSRIFHVHGKDATIHWDVIKKYGIHSTVNEHIINAAHVKLAPQFAYHRTPGFGDSNWTDIISELRKGGFTGSIDIEGWHDPVYRDELEMTGQVHALRYLKRCRGGEFVENPPSH